MKAKTSIVHAIVISSGFIFHSAFGQGPLTPPGAPAPMMKSLDQVEARTAITNTASLVTLSQPGSYYLTHNLTVTSGDGIDITVSGVTLDLNGFTIRSTAASVSGYGILATNVLSNVSIANGFVQSSGTGTGFNTGIGCYGLATVNVRVSNVSVYGCVSNGIVLPSIDSTVVESCTVRTLSGIGIQACTVKGCSAAGCLGNGISGTQVSDCRGQSVGSGYGISATTAQNCSGDGNNSYGIFAITALNCSGTSQNSTGVFATMAQNCNGSSNGASGNGVFATGAENCYGFAGFAGTGLVVSGTATGCNGYSTSGTGLSAFIATGCHGTSPSGTPLAVTHNVNTF